MSTHWKARRFGPGLPPLGEEARFEVSPEGIRLRDAERGSVRLPDSLTIRTVGLDGRGLELAWEDLGGRHALQVLEAGQAAALAAALPKKYTGALATLDRDRFRAKYRRSILLSALVGIALLPFLGLLVLVWKADALADWVIEWIPVSNDRVLGDLGFAQLQPGLKLLPPEDPHSRAVETIGTRLARDSTWQYRFHVEDNPELNAYALPGGIVVVHSGLIAATHRPEELAGVLAHEIRHVEERHSVKALVKSFGLRALWVMVTGDLAGTFAGELGASLIENTFSRDAEREADEGGFDLLVARQIDPSGMESFFGTLADEERKSGLPGPVAWFSTHPQSLARQQALAERLKNLPQHDFPPLAIEPWPPAER